jgi:hypothetical protein
MIYLISIFTLFVSYISSIKLADKINLDQKLINFFFIIKFLYFLMTIYYISFDSIGTDAKSFYLNSDNFDSKTFWIGDNLLYGINYFFKEYFYLDFYSINVLTFFLVLWSTLLLLNIIGTIKNEFLKFSLYILLLLPSLNFWTNGLSKDMFCYCALSFFVFGMFKKNHFLIILSIFCIFLVRPYVLFFILLSFCFVGFIYIVKKKLSFYKIIFFIFSLFLSITLIYFISNNLMGSFGRYFLSGDFIQILTNLQKHYVDTPLGIHIETNFIVRFFNYFFYPYPWSELYKEIFYLVMIFENLFLIYLFIFVILKNLKEKNFIYNRSIYNFISIISFIMLGIVLSQVTSNLGIAFRQKWMILPFIIVMISCNSNRANQS